MADENTEGTGSGPAADQDTLSPMLEAVSRPISPANPCGIDPSYDDDYLAIKAEIDKLSTVSGRVDQERAAELRQMMDATRGTLTRADRAEAEKQLDQRASVVKDASGPDYRLIKDRAVTILSGKSKDIRVACYLCYALWQTESFAGLAEGLGAMEIVTRQFWDGLYPPRTRPAARKNAVDFLTSKLGDSVEYAHVSAGDRQPLERAQKFLAGLQREFAEKMPEGPPSLLGLTQAVEKCLRKVPVSTPVATGSPSAGVSAEPKPSPGGEPPSLSAATAGEIRTAQDAADSIRKSARFLREQSRKNPVPYRLIRTLRWDPLTAAPPAENGRTKIEAPPLQRRNYLSGLRDTAEWEKLLDECETSIGQPGFHLWLDMQRLVVTALDALGEEYRPVRSAVLSELGLLAQRLPVLTALSFADGTRMADPATSVWIEEKVVGATDTVPTAGTVHTAQHNVPAPDARWAEAAQMVDRGDLAGAIAMLQTHAEGDRSGQGAFRRTLAVAGACLRGGQPAIARPLLEHLGEELREHGLDEWDPTLALETWATQRRCYDALAARASAAAKPELQQLADNVFNNICRIDPGFALASSGAAMKPKRTAAAPANSAAAGPAEPEKQNGSNKAVEAITQPQS